jgi:hypothetical protein
VAPTATSVPTQVPTVQPTPTAEPTGVAPLNATGNPGGNTAQGPITPADRQAAAARAAKARANGLKTLGELSAEALPAMNPGGTPDYFGTIPNYANSPIPASVDITGDGTGAAAKVVMSVGGVITNVTITNGGSGYTAAATTAMVVGGGGSGAIIQPIITSGKITSMNIISGGSGYNTVPGIRKFVDSLPGLNAAGANDLGQYIPVAVSDPNAYPGSDYYEIALVQYTEKLHSDLPATTLRGYVQISTTNVPGKHIQ